MARVSDDRKLSLTLRVAKFGKPDKVRLVNRLDEISNERRSGRSFRLKVVSKLELMLRLTSFVDAIVSDVSLLP